MFSYTHCLIKQFDCSYWDVELKIYTNFGCERILFDSNEIVWCRCNHTTFFAIIAMQQTPYLHIFNIVIDNLLIAAIYFDLILRWINPNLHYQKIAVYNFFDFTNDFESKKTYTKVEFWNTNKDNYPILCQAFIRIFINPAIILLRILYYI
ncbi:hypothetical protein BpHYR1_054640 [Brachionus plicatilis]|uniref:Uncharacterized protein n=1 Tax=Brachionus plicatilis TaxID=10195 RepID=A0A3M7R1V1_BRAPC|nr:hypothetical protein BpHYR1_054640 [Brachionus plicatilis]